ncbi:hypothetical protein OG612_29450 [Streptomyces sp. NBC_01527]|uniref:DUF6624 domain-containing protein n=1 Tax=Streptomyces sp. NBC_01527 TaxID=2903894 RepID=UPI003862F4E6
MNGPHQPGPNHVAFADELLGRAKSAREQWRTPGSERVRVATDALATVQQTQQADAAGLKRIVERLGRWPGRSTVGEEACQAAVNLAVHCDHDPAFQHTLLRLLQTAVRAGEATSAQLAHLHDRCLVNAGHPQLYGTQHWYRADGQLEPLPITDIAQLDTRRAGAGLPPYAEQARHLRERHGPLGSLSLSATAEPIPLSEGARHESNHHHRGELEFGEGHQLGRARRLDPARGPGILVQQEVQPGQLDVQAERLGMDGYLAAHRPTSNNDNIRRGGPLAFVEEYEARYWASAPHGNPAAVPRCVNVSGAHGPDSRVDRAYLTPELLPAVAGFEVIEVDEDLSDHHLRLTLDGDRLAEVLMRAGSGESVIGRVQRPSVDNSPADRGANRSTQDGTRVPVPLVGSVPL